MGVINIAGLKEASGEVFPTIPAGSYKARITKVEETVTGKDSKNPGSPMLKFTVKLIDAEAQNQQLFMNILLPCQNADAEKNEMSKNRVKRLVIACGLTADDQFDTGDFMGAEFLAVVALTEKDGVKRNEIKDQLPIV